MVNPITQPPASAFPPKSFPVLDENGGLSISWYGALLGLWQRTGGAAGGSITQVQQQAAAAQVTATSALATATSAQTLAVTAEALAAAANAEALSAQATASSASTTANNALAKASNLSDLANPATARQNLGVDVFPISFSFKSTPSGLIYIPIVRSLILPSNFAGTFTFCGTVPTANAVFTLSVVRPPVTMTIGNITLLAGSHINATFSLQPAFTLIASDTLFLSAPGSPDATLADVGITVKTILN